MVNHKKGNITVQIAHDGTPFIAVPVSQISDVRRILIETGIGHTLGPDAKHEPGSIETQIIHIVGRWNRDHIEHALASLSKRADQGVPLSEGTAHRGGIPSPWL